MRRSFCLRAAFAALVLFSLAAATAAPVAAECRSCQRVPLNPDFCFPDENGWTLCNDTNGCKDDEIPSSQPCGDNPGNGGGGGGGGGGDDGGDDSCSGGWMCPAECASCDPDATGGSPPLQD